MHNGALKKWALALTFWLALHTSLVKAQVFTNDLPLQADTTGTNPVDFEFRSDGTLIGKGNLGVGSLLSTDQGAGTKMFWFPSLAAFRAGYISGTQWNQSSVGEYSSAFGENSTASGKYSLATGYSTTASGGGSVAFGYGTTASSGNSSSFGFQTAASGWCSVATGLGTSASGNYTVTQGYLTNASGWASTAFGAETYATGSQSIAAGVFTNSSAYLSVAVGSSNTGGGNPTHWVATDPLFEVGNGGQYGTGNPAASGPSDALVVYKNGNVTAQGVVTAAPGGDIPMYTGN